MLKSTCCASNAIRTNKETLNAVFRSFHTIKGGAGFMGLPALVAACHLTENLFDALRTGAAPVTPLAIEAALQASGFVADQLNDLNNGATPEQLAPMPQDLERILKDAIEGKAEAAPAAAPAPPWPAAPAAGGLMRPAGSRQSATTASTGPAMYNAVVPARFARRHRPGARRRRGAAARCRRPRPLPPRPAAAAKPAGTASTAAARARPPPAAPAKDESIRIDAVKLDALLEVAGESVQAANQAAVLLERLAQFKFEGQAATLMATLTETLERASRYSAELQRATLATRMQPVGRLFQKFPRLVRELAKDLGKDVELTIEGAETEVDRVVVDSLYDPLVHMLRNALDHGVESPQDRVAAGKPAKAFILLKAWQEANSVMIVLQDDGKGMDPVKLRRKAIDKGLIGETAHQSDDDAYQLVFLPGFSTKEVASSVSGRGVGMDVVKTAVEKNRGAIRIDSSLGHGTKFAIRLPIELSIVPTMLVSTSGASLALPMAVVERVVELPETFMHGRRRPGAERPGPSAAGALAGLLARLRGSCVERVGIVINAPQPYILAVEAVDGTADLVIKPMTALHGRRHHRHGALGRRRTGAGGRPVLPDGWLPQHGAHGRVNALNE
jgi:two-component system chemotaxis sensor kinase CheA